MKVVNEITQCKLCYNLIQVPVLLVCCSESICQKHIDEIKSKNIENKFICSLCDHKHEHDIFPVNKAIEKLLSTHFDKINLGKDYQEAKQKCEKLKSLIRQLKDTITNPRTYIDEYVSNIRMKIDLRREETKKDIDDLCDRLMNDLDTFKNECYANIEPLMEEKDYMDQLDEIIEDFDVDVCLEDFEFFDVDKTTWEDYGGEAMDQIEKTTDIFRKLKNDLLLQKICKLSKTMDMNKFTKDFSDEFKIESRLELNFWLHDFWINYFLLFFSLRFDNVIKCEIKQFSNNIDLSLKNGKKRKKIFTSELIKSGEFEFRAYVYVDDESNLGAFLNCATDNNKK